MIVLTGYNKLLGTPISYLKKKLGILNQTPKINIKPNPLTLKEVLLAKKYKNKIVIINFKVQCQRRSIFITLPVVGVQNGYSFVNLCQASFQHFWLCWKARPPGVLPTDP